MKQYIIKHWMLPVLTVLCMAGLATACDKDKEEDRTNDEPSKAIVSKEYKEYLSATGLRSDAQGLVDLLSKYELLELQYIKMASGDWKEPLFSTYDFSNASAKHFYEVLGEIVENADDYETAIQRLGTSGAMGTNSPTTRGFDNIPFYTAVKLLGYLKMSGKACRAAIVGVVQQSGHANDAAWLKKRYDLLDPARQRGATDYADWWNKFSRGEFDSRACTIFGDMMCGNDYEFVETAEELGVNRSSTIRSIAVPMIMTGVNLVLNLTPTGTIAAETMEILGNVSNLADSIKSGGSTAGAITHTVTSIAKTVYNHYGKAPVDGGNKFYGDILENGQKELLLGVTGDVEERIAETLDNLVSKTAINPEPESIANNTKKGAAEFTDKDKQTPADVVIAVDKDGKNISIGTPDKNGKTTVILPAGTEMSITAIDKSGDKHTERVTVPAGKTVVIEGSTTETMNVEVEHKDQTEKPAISTTTKKLEFEPDGGEKYFKVTYKGLFVAAVVQEDEAEGWCRVDVDEKGEVTVLVMPNSSSENRSCTLAIGAWNEQSGDDMEIVEVKVEQKGSSLPLGLVGLWRTQPVLQGWDFHDFYELRLHDDGSFYIRKYEAEEINGNSLSILEPGTHGLQSELLGSWTLSQSNKITFTYTSRKWIDDVGNITYDDKPHKEVCTFSIKTITTPTGSALQMDLTEAEDTDLPFSDNLGLNPSVHSLYRGAFPALGDSDDYYWSFYIIGLSNE